MSIRQENRKKNIRGLLITLAAVIVLVAVGLAVVASQNSTVFQERAEGYYFSASDASVYSKVGSGFAVASTSELQVFNADGTQTLQETYIMSDPAMSAGGNNAALYDIGGNTVKIFTTESIVLNLNTEGRVISAKVNSNGWTVVCCEETGYQGAAYVYNSSGILVFKWLSGSGYVLNADICDENEYLAVLTVGADGTRIVKLNLSDESYKKEFTVSDELLLDLSFNSKGNLYAVSDENIYLAKNDEIEVIYTFGDMNLTDYCLGDNVVLALSEYRSGGSGRIVNVTSDGEEQEVAAYDGGILSIDTSKKYIAVLTDSGLYIYDNSDFELAANYEISACLRVLMYEDGAAVAISRNSAGVYSAKADRAENRKGQ